MILGYHNLIYGIILTVLVMTKLQQSRAYEYTKKDGKTKQHMKSSLNIPEDLIEELGWSKGEELELIVEGNTLKVKPKHT